MHWLRRLSSDMPGRSHLFGTGRNFQGLTCSLCANCHCCIVACEHDAISLQHVGIAKFVRRLMNRPLAAE